MEGIEKRVEEFTVDGKNFVYIDFSDFKVIEDCVALIEIIKPVISKYPENSIYTITNIGGVRFDTGIKEAFSEYMQSNAPYVKYGAVIGLDGVKKMFMRIILKMSGRSNIELAFSKKTAIDVLLKHDD